jgi:hypothetical protein
MPSSRRIAALGWFLALLSPCAAQDTAIPARDLSARSKNIAPEYPRFGNLTLCVGSDGFMEWTAELDGGKRYVHFYYASGERRPCALSINGSEVAGEVLGETTGGFMPRDLRWRTYGPFRFIRGANRIRISAPGRYMPHLKGLYLSSGSEPPKGTIFKDAPPRAAVPPRKVDYGRLAAENPSLDFEKILFIKRHTYQSSHYYTTFSDGCRYYGGNLCVLTLKDGAVTELVPQLKGGIFGRYDLSFDGRRVVFGYKSDADSGFRIYEVGVDGKGLRQLTFPDADEPERMRKYAINPAHRHYTDDMHPCYLPDGGICFISTRCEHSILCNQKDMLITSVLYRMDADGKNITKLTHSPISEAAPSVMADGRILYTRWEYVDKGAVVVKALWAMRPDGTGSVEIFGNDVALPDTFYVGRAIPGRSDLLVAVGAPHMPLGVGTVIRLDLAHDIRTRQPMTYMTPNVDVQQEWGFNHLVNGRWQRVKRGPLFTDPYPLSETHFLVSMNRDRPWNDTRAYDLYLLEEGGETRLIYDDPDISCWLPVPLRPRPRPPVSLATIDPDLARRKLARVVVTDVYKGLSGVERGTIRYLRVNEQLPRPWAARRRWDGDGAYQQHAVIDMDCHYALKLQHGIVPVEPDGSAHFLVEADRNIFLQALDKDFMEVQRERTYVNYRPGETRACIGCHEKPGQTGGIPAGRVLALRRPPSRPGPQPGEETGARTLYYPRDVQPVFDLHCVECHGPKKQDGGLDLSGTPTMHFNRSYENLIKKKYLTLIRENHPKIGNAHYLPAKSLGSHNSRLVAVLLDDHYDVKLTPAERIRITTWVDSNGQYYGSYWGRRNLKYKDHPNFRPDLPFEQARSETSPLPESQR